MATEGKKTDRFQISDLEERIAPSFLGGLLGGGGQEGSGSDGLLNLDTVTSDLVDNLDLLGDIDAGGASGAVGGGVNVGVDAGNVGDVTAGAGIDAGVSASGAALGNTLVDTGGNTLDTLGNLDVSHLLSGDDLVGNLVQDIGQDVGQVTDIVGQVGQDLPLDGLRDMLNDLTISVDASHADNASGSVSL